MWIAVVRALVGAACVLAVAGCGLALPGRSQPAPDVRGPRLAPGTGRHHSAPDTDQARPACRDPCATAAVVRVIDGDTLVLHGIGRVRLIGLDAPETWLRHDCFGREAARALRHLTPPGSPVQTAGDIERRDHYGRRLLYLWTPSGEFVNATLVREGFARAMPIRPNTSYAPLIHAAEDAARRGGAGIWHPDLAGCTLAR